MGNNACSPQSNSLPSRGIIQELPNYSERPPIYPPYPRGRLFERECFEKYFHQLIELLESKSSVTVSGSVGCGKSVFYLYCFERLRREYPARTIVATCWNFQNPKAPSYVFLPGHKLGKRHDGVPVIRGAIYLFDGIPPCRPLGQVVCFSPFESPWMEQIYPSGSDACLYLPLWTLDELVEGNRQLRLGLETQEIERRFALIGGRVGDCWNLSKKNFDLVRDNVDWVLQSVISRKQIRAWLNFFEICRVSRQASAETMYSAVDVELTRIFYELDAKDQLLCTKRALMVPHPVDQTARFYLNPNDRNRTRRLFQIIPRSGPHGFAGSFELEFASPQLADRLERHINSQPSPDNFETNCQTWDFELSNRIKEFLIGPLHNPACYPTW